MTTIHDISNNLITTKQVYNVASTEFNDLYKDYEDKRARLVHLPFEERCMHLYKEAFIIADAQIITQIAKNNYDRAHYLTGSDIKHVKISSTKMKTKHAEMCRVCMEHHAYKDIIKTSCNHHFGKKCFSKWIRNCFVNYREVTCALCRSNDFTITRYTSNKNNTNKQ